MSQLAYLNYWKRKQLMETAQPRFPLLRWFPTQPPDDGFSPIEALYFQKSAQKRSILDVGAGDLRVMKKFQKAGFQGEYHTLDAGREYSYTYQNLDEVKREYDLIICLDVIEHLPLEAGLGMVHQMISLLGPSGTLILQTPNARCIRYPLSWDMTHLHCYSLPDLWSYLSALSTKLNVEGYRVAFGRSGRGLIPFLSRFVIAKLLGADYAENIALIATRAI